MQPCIPTSGMQSWVGGGIFQFASIRLRKKNSISEKSLIPNTNMGIWSNRPKKKNTGTGLAFPAVQFELCCKSSWPQDLCTAGEGLSPVHVDLTRRSQLLLPLLQLGSKLAAGGASPSQGSTELSVFTTPADLRYSWIYPNKRVGGGFIHAQLYW